MPMTSLFITDYIEKLKVTICNFIYYLSLYIIYLQTFLCVFQMLVNGWSCWWGAEGVHR